MAYEKSWDLPLMSEAVSLDGELIEDHVDGYHTINVSGRESLEYDFDEDDRPTGVDGMEYYDKRQGGRTLTVRFALSATTPELFMQRYRALKAFCRGEDRIIRFADEPNAHYVGTLQSIEEPDEGSLNVISEMAFYCPDPYLISDILTEVTGTAESDHVVLEIENNSSGAVYPTYRIQNVDENGYIGIVQTAGVFEMGNIEEADTESYQQSEKLVSGVSEFSDYTGTNPQNSSIGMSGSLTYYDSAQEWLTISSAGTNNNYWHGGCKRIQLPPDSNGEVGAKNFYCWWESRFETGQMGQTGFQQVLLSDEDDKFIGGFGIIKDDTTGNTAKVKFWKNDGSEYKSINFTPNNQDASNAFHQKGYEDLLKEGSKLKYYYYGTYYTLDMPAIEEKKVTYIYIVIGQWANSSKSVTVNRVGRFYAKKLQVDKEEDAPNRYVEGSEIVIDCSADTIEIDGLPKNDELVTGSEFCALEPGTTTVEVYPSSWVTTMPTVTAEFYERWL